MATLEEVLAALNSATTDAREVLTKIPQIATTNGDVSFTFADGTQVNLPGLPKLKSQVDNFIAGAETNIKSWWIRYVKVHQQDGSDSTGDGTTNAPFKSIQKAVSSVPPGGVVFIELLDNYTCSLDTGTRESLGNNRLVKIYGALDSAGNPQFTLKNDSSVGPYSGLVIGTGTALEIDGLILESNDNGNTANHWKMLIKTNIGTHSFSLRIGRWANFAEVPKTTKIILNGVQLVDFEVATGEFQLIGVDIDAPGHDSNNTLALVFPRIDKKILFNYSAITDLTNGGVVIPARGLI